MSELEQNFLKFSTKRVLDKPVMMENRLKRKAIVDDGIIRNAHEEANYLKNRMLNVLQSSINIIKDGNDDVEGGAYSKVTEGIYKKANQYQSKLTQKRLQGMTEGPAVQFVDENKLTPEETGKENEINSLLLKIETSISNLNLTSGIVANMNELYDIILNYGYVISQPDIETYIDKLSKIGNFLQQKFVKKGVNKKELQIADTIITISNDCVNVLTTMTKYPNASLRDKRLILQQSKSSVVRGSTSKLDNRIQEEVDMKESKIRSGEQIGKFLAKKVKGYMAPKREYYENIDDIDALTEPEGPQKPNEEIFSDIDRLNEEPHGKRGSTDYMNNQINLIK